MAKAREVIAQLPSGVFNLGRKTIEGYFIVGGSEANQATYFLNQHRQELADIIRRIIPSVNNYLPQEIIFGSLAVQPNIVRPKMTNNIIPGDHLIGIMRCWQLYPLNIKDKSAVQDLVNLVNANVPLAR